MKDNTQEVLLEKLARRVKQLREEKGLTQYQCYIDTKIHFGRIERGERDISFTTLFKLCDFFEMNVDEFLNQPFREIDS